MIRRLVFVAIFFFIYLLSGAAPRALSADTPQFLPRTVLALYHGKNNDRPQFSQIHRLAQMPLNHLGVKLTYHDITTGLPDLSHIVGLIGVLSWYDSGTQLEKPVEYLQWLGRVVRSGKKVVIMGDPGFENDSRGRPVASAHINRFYRLLGIRDLDEWISYTYDLEIVHKNPGMIEFERKYKGSAPPYSRRIAINHQVQSHLVVRKAGQRNSGSHVVITSPSGAFVADGYAIYVKNTGQREIKSWYINPFVFFREAFELNNLPKPDTTTLAGRRIYYSHIDGDGWRNTTRIEKYRKERRLSSDIIREEIIQAFPDMPVTVTAVAAELDPNWNGTEESRAVAKRFFTLPQVELGSHTYSHPFEWAFFENSEPEKEKPYLRKYPDGGRHDSGIIDLLLSAITRKEEINYSYNESGLHNTKYVTPRAFARQPFDLDMELSGSAAYLNSLAPAGKKVKAIMWSGDTTPFEEAIKRTRLLGLYNINGGDSRFDDEFPSYAWVSPIGRSVGNEIQIYASNSNENTYTDLWQARFHGFRYLVDTLRNTEHPVRIKPVNIYYHMYSGEHRASVDAIISTINYARSKEIIPITTSRYCSIAEGFFSTRIQQIGPMSWTIENRGGLQTIRFDNPEKRVVDVAGSKGVIGQRLYQGSLYVYLDASRKRPVIRLKKRVKPLNRLHSIRPFLFQSRWRVWRLRASGKSFSFEADGFGNPEMIWRVPHNGKYNVSIFDRKGRKLGKIALSAQNRVLRINSTKLKNRAVRMLITHTGI